MRVKHVVGVIELLPHAPFGGTMQSAVLYCRKESTLSLALSAPNCARESATAARVEIVPECSQPATPAAAFKSDLNSFGCKLFITPKVGK
jgi:hypothetical protein